MRDGASQIYRGEQLALRRPQNTAYGGRDLGSTVEQAIREVNQKVKLPPATLCSGAGEYASAKRANARLALIVPVTVAVIFFLLYCHVRLLQMGGARDGKPGPFADRGHLCALFHRHAFQRLSGIGTLALFGVAVETGVIMIEYINQLRARGYNIHEAAVEGAVLRLRPIMMTMLVATLGLLPARSQPASVSDSQKPFAIVIVAA